eukprot:6178166-Pleurochrysis_carterae.AAC.2
MPSKAWAQIASSKQKQLSITNILDKAAEYNQPMRFYLGGMSLLDKSLRSNHLRASAFFIRSQPENRSLGEELLLIPPSMLDTSGGGSEVAGEPRRFLQGGLVRRPSPPHP